MAHKVLRPLMALLIVVAFSVTGAVAHQSPFSVGQVFACSGTQVRTNTQGPTTAEFHENCGPNYVWGVSNYPATYNGYATTYEVMYFYGVTGGGSWEGPYTGINGQGGPLVSNTRGCNQDGGHYTSATIDYGTSYSFTPNTASYGCL